MKRLSVDPGLTTGWLTFTPIDRLNIEVHEWDETRGEAEFEAIAWELNRQDHISDVVCEHFAPWQDNKARTWQPEALHIIGTLRFIFGIKNVDLRQKASDAKAWGIRERIDPFKAPPLRMKSRTGDEHVFMALKHALLWTATKWDGRA